MVATAPTVYGIETYGTAINVGRIQLQQHLPFTVLKLSSRGIRNVEIIVATAPTVYGIETRISDLVALTVDELQQHLPFTVLKPSSPRTNKPREFCSCNSTYRLRY